MQMEVNISAVPLSLGSFEGHGARVTRRFVGGVRDAEPIRLVLQFACSGVSNEHNYRSGGKTSI